MTFKEASLIIKVIHKIVSHSFKAGGLSCVVNNIEDNEEYKLEMKMHEQKADGYIHLLLDMIFEIASKEKETIH